MGRSGNEQLRSTLIAVSASSFKNRPLIIPNEAHFTFRRLAYQQSLLKRLAFKGDLNLRHVLQTAGTHKILLFVTDPGA
jgi:hypothetical protein